MGTEGQENQEAVLYKSTLKAILCAKQPCRLYTPKQRPQPRDQGGFLTSIKEHKITQEIPELIREAALYPVAVCLDVSCHGCERAVSLYHETINAANLGDLCPTGCSTYNLFVFLRVPIPYRKY